MARPATGQVVVRKRERGRVFALRFRAYGERQYVTLGSDADGWDRKRAETELENVLADVRRGIWRPPKPEPIHEPPTDPTFHEFASEWWVLNKDRLAPKTQQDYLWRLQRHLLPYFAKFHLDEITVDTVERYIAAKLDEKRPLSPRSLNMTLTLGTTIMESAAERFPEAVPRNPFRDADAACGNAGRSVPTSTTRRRSKRYSTPPAIWTTRRNAAPTDRQEIRPPCRIARPHGYARAIHTGPHRPREGVGHR